MMIIERFNRNDQRGMALILAIGLLGILSILGAVVLTTATRELASTSSFLPNRQAFYAADRVVEYAMNRDIIINIGVGGEIDLVDDDALDSDGDSLGMKHKEIVETSAIGTLTSGSVVDLGPNILPPAMAATHGTEFGANFYHVDVDATALGARSRVDASIVRLFKLDDDQIFRTSGGG